MNIILLSNNAFGFIGGIVSVISFTTPIIPFITCLKRELNIQKIPFTVLVLALISSLMQMAYGLLLPDQLPLVIANTLGVIVTAIWLCLYLVLYAECKLIPSLIYIIILISGICESFYLVNTIIGSIGLCVIEVCTAACILLKYIGLLSHVMALIKRKEANRVTYVSVIFEMGNCLIWVAYGVTMGNYLLDVSYAIGFVIVSGIAKRLVRVYNESEISGSVLGDTKSKGETVITIENESGRKIFGCCVTKDSIVV